MILFSDFADSIIGDLALFSVVPFYLGAGLLLSAYFFYLT